MATDLIDPFDDPGFRPKARDNVVNSTLIDPFDTPESPGQAARASGGVLNPQPQQEPKRTSDVLGVSGAVDLFTGRDRETQKTRELPEIGSLSTGKAGTDFKVALGLLATANPDEQISIIKKQIPGATTRKDEKGNTFVKVGNEEFVLNKPGISYQDSIQAIANVLAFIPAAKLSAIPKEIVKRAGVGATTAGLTEAGIQGVQKSLGGEFDVDDVAIASGLGGVAELVVPGIQSIRKARAGKKLGATGDEFTDAAISTQKAKQAVSGVEDQTGVKVGLFPAQQTGVPSELAKQRIIPQLDQGSKIALNGLKTQNDEAYQATVRMLDIIAPAKNVSDAPQRLRTAAETAIKAQKHVRKEASKFKQVIEAADKAGAGAKVNLGPVDDLINDLIDESVTGGQLESTVKRVKGFLSPKEGKSFLSFRQLQRAKKEIDGIINKVGDDAIDPSVKGEITKIKQQLVKQMKEGFEPFKDASETFARESGAVEEIQQSLIGRISKVSDKQLKSISSEIFNPRTNVADVTKARNVISKVDPQAWDDIVRNELEFRIGSLVSEVKDMGADSIQNLPGIIKRGLYGNTKQRAVLLRSMSSTQRKNFVFLETVLNRAASGRAPGSPTTSFQEIVKAMRGRLGILKDALTKPINSIQEAGDTSLFGRRVRSLAKAAFDSKWEPKMKEIRKFGIDSPSAARAMTQLLNDIEKETEQ